MTAKQLRAINPDAARDLAQALSPRLPELMPVPPRPKPKLKPGTIYSGDNGRLLCVHCAGMSAKFTGYDLSGHRVIPLGQDDALEWEAHFGEPMSCEGGCTTYRSIRQV